MSLEDPLKRPAQSLEGQVFHPGENQELFHVMKMAFDYRGDVTLKLHNGKCLTGYVFDCNELADQPYLRLFVEHCSDPQMVPYAEIEEIVFSGEDTAFGRSWEDWAKKWNKDSSSM